MNAARPARATIVVGVAAVVATGVAVAILALPGTADRAPVAVTIPAGASTAPERSADLAAVVAQWPESYLVTGTKSEPFYVEHITIERAGSRFELIIDVRAQGEAALGVQHDVVTVDSDGALLRATACPAERAGCLTEPVRGFLSAASLLVAERQGRLPATGIIRAFGGTEVICVADSDLHPAASAVAAVADPCFSVATGAVLAHWSSASAAFTAATLAPDFVEHIPDGD